MQLKLKLPAFPLSTKLINSFVGFKEEDGFVYYFLSGSPIYCHKVDDRDGYKHTLASLVFNNLCTISELSVALGERRKNIERYAKAFRLNGSRYFFNREDNRGQCHKMTPDLLLQIQQKLDTGTSMYRIAKDFNISDSAIAYHINKGTLKKNIKK